MVSSALIPLVLFRVFDMNGSFMEPIEAYSSPFLALLLRTSRQTSGECAWGSLLILNPLLMLGLYVLLGVVFGEITDFKRIHFGFCSESSWG